MEDRSKIGKNRCGIRKGNNGLLLIDVFSRSLSWLLLVFFLFLLLLTIGQLIYNKYLSKQDTFHDYSEVKG